MKTINAQTLDEVLELQFENFKSEESSPFPYINEGEEEIANSLKELGIKRREYNKIISLNVLRNFPYAKSISEEELSYIFAKNLVKLSNKILRATTTENNPLLLEEIYSLAFSSEELFTIDRIKEITKELIDAKETYSKNDAIRIISRNAAQMYALNNVIDEKKEEEFESKKNKKIKRVKPNITNKPNKIDISGIDKKFKPNKIAEKNFPIITGGFNDLKNTLISYQVWDKYYQKHNLVEQKLLLSLFSLEKKEVVGAVRETNRYVQEIITDSKYFISELMISSNITLKELSTITAKILSPIEAIYFLFNSNHNKPNMSSGTNKKREKKEKKTSKRNFTEREIFSLEENYEMIPESYLLGKIKELKRQIVYNNLASCFEAVRETTRNWKNKNRNNNNSNSNNTNKNGNENYNIHLEILTEVEKTFFNRINYLFEQGKKYKQSDDDLEFKNGEILDLVVSTYVDLLEERLKTDDKSKLHENDSDHLVFYKTTGHMQNILTISGFEKMISEYKLIENLNYKLSRSNELKKNQMNEFL